MTSAAGQLLVIHAQSVRQTMAVGKSIAMLARPGDVIALVGDLGAGKTQLVRGMAVGLGIDERHVASPTYVMVQEYESPDGLTLVHIDAYRLQSAADLDSIGWERGGEELARGAVVAVEWAERLGESLGDDHLRVELAHVSNNQRRITIVPKGSWRDRLEELSHILKVSDVERAPLKDQ